MSLTHNNNFKWYLVRDNFLSKDECEDIIKIIDDESKQIDTCGAQVVKLNEKIYLDKVWNIMKLSNDIHFKFDIDSVQLQESKYY